MDNLKPYAKAITGGLVGGLTAAVTALADGTVSPAEGAAIALAFVLGLGIVYAVPNTPAD